MVQKALRRGRLFRVFLCAGVFLAMGASSAELAAQQSRPQAGKSPGSSKPAARPQVVQPPRPTAPTTPTAPDTVRPALPVVYSFDHYPTFADHDPEATRRENLLPAKFPVLPLYQVSEKLPGYVDPLRRISMLTFGGAVAALSPTYASPEAYAEARATIAYEQAGGADDKERLEPVAFDRVKTLEGVEVLREHYMFVSQDEKWDRVVLSTAFEEDGKVKYLKVVCHFPTEIRSMAVQELGYYTDHMHINSKPRP